MSSDKRFHKIDTLALTLANTQYSYAFQEDVKEYTISARGHNEIKLAYVSGDIALGNYITIPGKSAKTDQVNYKGILPTQRTIFVSCDQSGETLEIEYWV